MASEDAISNQPVDLTSVVAKHYNQLEEKGLEEREKSRIFHMRNFNNWMKSMLIGDFLSKIKSEDKRDRHDRHIRVLDIGAGKGGDLLKWKKGDIRHLVCADIAETSLEQCQQRYNDMRDRDRRRDMFTLECIPADCTKVRLKDLYKDKNQMFDIVSCQFSFHYCFESLPQAQCMLRNASECLKPGGYFIGTTPDAFDIIRRLQESDSLSFGNEIFSATFESKDNIPLFGAKYAFHLEGVVDCPEFLVYFPALIELASQFGLKLVYRKRFDEFFEDHIKNHEGLSLLGRMQALETYPAQSHGAGSSKETEPSKAFQHAEKYMEEHKLNTPEEDRHRRDRGPPKVGTLSQTEWEAISIYIVYAFIKEDSSKDDSRGKVDPLSKDDPPHKDDPVSDDESSKDDPSKEDSNDPVPEEK